LVQARQREFRPLVHLDVSNCMGSGLVALLLDPLKKRLDVLFTKLGMGELPPLGAITELSFDKTFGVNVRGTLFTVQKECR
jgi:NAD(P)-dependent dehydrogenase (short-subunit alcohol dehydrogenase family)